MNGASNITSISVAAEVVIYLKPDCYSILYYVLPNDLVPSSK